MDAASKPKPGSRMPDSKPALSALRAAVLDVGFGCLEEAIDGALLADLRAEARAHRQRALSVSSADAVRYRARLADLGPIAQAFLDGDDTQALLHSIFGRRFSLSPRASCYTYYACGDFLSAHQDTAGDCEATVIVYLEARSPAPAAASGLHLRILDGPVDRHPVPRAIITARAGALVVGRGAQVWHERSVLRAGERVVALTACFRERPA